MKLKEKKGQKVDASVLLKSENKTLVEEIKGQIEGQELEKRSSRDCLTWGSTRMQSPNPVTIADAK